MLRNVLVQIGNGTKQHYGHTAEIRGIERTFIRCGTKSLRGRAVLDEFELSKFIASWNACEKCLERAMKEATELEKAGN